LVVSINAVDRKRSKEPKFNILIDTYVWLDVAKDYQQQAILAALEELIRLGDIELILPRTVVDEFARNKARVIEESSRSLSSTLKRQRRPWRSSETHGKRTPYCDSSPL
jgi:PIN domain